MRATLTHRCAACHEEVRVTALWWFGGNEKRCICEHCVSVLGFSFRPDGEVGRWALRGRLAAALAARKGM